MQATTACRLVATIMIFYGGEHLKTKYPYVCNAELNGILNNIRISLHGCRIYTALFPCNECVKAIINTSFGYAHFKLSLFNSSLKVTNCENRNFSFLKRKTLDYTINR